MNVPAVWYWPGSAQCVFRSFVFLLKKLPVVAERDAMRAVRRNQNGNNRKVAGRRAKLRAAADAEKIIRRLINLSDLSHLSHYFHAVFWYIVKKHELQPKDFEFFIITFWLDHSCKASPVNMNISDWLSAVVAPLVSKWIGAVFNASPAGNYT